MKTVLQARDIHVSELDVHTLAHQQDDPPGTLSQDEEWSAPLLTAINAANAECRADPELIIRITIETVKVTR